MDLSSLKSAPGARKRTKRSGRGTGCTRGKTCGRGAKGQKARSGSGRRRGFEGGQMPLHRRLPKRGFRTCSRRVFGIVNLDRLDAAFDEGAEVTSAAIVQAGIADRAPAGIKILGRGDVSKKLDVAVEAVSPQARSKIEAAGGTVTVVDRRKDRREQVKATEAADQKTDEHEGR